jgi:predicted ATP-grasp superfamily ATP-dependent carboligase
MKTVLIVGGGLQAVSAARSLHDAGFRTGLWAPPGDYSLSSKALDFRGYGRYNDGITPLLSFIRDNKVDVAIPMSDVYASMLSENRENISETTGCVAAVPGFQQLELAADKLRLMDLCARKGFPHPRTLEGDAVNADTVRALSFPVLVKPNHSVGARGIVKVTDPAKLVDKVAEVTAKYGSCHVQEFIEGGRPYFNVMVYRDVSGKCVNHAVLEIIRYYPLQGGSSSMCRTVEAPELVELAMKVLNEIGYVGFADFDILQTVDGEPRIIEINPRVPASLRGAAVSGVNFPALIARDALGLPLESFTYSPGKTLRYLGLDMMWFMSSPDRFKSRPNWFRFWGKDIYYQEGGFRDWKPMVRSLLANFNKIEFRGGRLRKKTD